MEQITIDDINLLDIGNTIQICGTVWSGRDQAFITLFPNKTEDFSNLKLLPMTLEDWERFIRQTDIQEVEIFAQDATGIVKKIVRKTQRQIDGYVQWRVFQRDNYTCRYCGRTGIPLTVDHVDLWEEGGASIEINLISACKRCNKDRGNMHYAPWLASLKYAKLSGALTPEQQQLNLDVIARLPELYLKRVINIRSR